MALKDRLKSARKAKKLSQKAVADGAGMSQPSYWELENGRSTSSAFISQIAAVLGVDAYELATGENKPPAIDSFATNLNVADDALNIIEKNIHLLNPEQKRRIIARLIEPSSENSIFESDRKNG